MSGEGELNDKICETADALVSFKSGTWTHFIK